MAWLLPLVAFSAVSSGTPGPNNLLLWGSGATFGFRRTVPHILGTAAGIGVMACAVAAGLGTLITTVPGLAFAMKVGGSLYLLYLAWQVAGASALRQAAVAKPLRFLQAAAFQAINPKAWIFALGAITTFRPADLPVLAGGIAVALTMMIVILPTAALWAVAGGAIDRMLRSDRARRVVSLVLALVLVASVVSEWLPA